MSFWRFDNRVKQIASSALAVREHVLDADMVIGTVLIPGSRAPKLVTNEMVAQMKPGSVLVDVAIDQGGCFEDSRPTTHDDPTFTVHDAIFYCVANMPGAVPNTSTWALTNATLPYVLRLAEPRAGATRCGRIPSLALGLNTHAGQRHLPGRRHRPRPALHADRHAAVTPPAGADSTARPPPATIGEWQILTS